MNRPLLVATPLLALALAVAPCVPAHAANYTVDPSHTSIVFSVSHLGFSFTYGMFRKSEGTVVFDGAAPEAAKFSLSVDVASIDTMNEARDAHLRNADFFDVEKFPKLTFVTKSVAVTKDKEGRTVLHAKGPMTLHGVTKEVTLPMVLLKEGVGPRGRQMAGFLCQTSINRSDFAVGAPGGVGDAIGITISFEAVMQ